MQWLVWEPFLDPSDNIVKAIVAERSSLAAAPGGAGAALTHLCTVADTQGTTCTQVRPWVTRLTAQQTAAGGRAPYITVFWPHAHRYCCAAVHWAVGHILQCSRFRHCSG